ncbi:TetR/AcrR family transcriptional regulator [Streptomyces sp. NBC_01089]|uniref:TetR/AcrR family transcriptional regulator n=1 Tax=Streptomyces sp. NBC_01089 TaxID=2903747 RepID=UPI0038642D0D|nr:TetR/AcrR family transcriptional regulator [Streptomyces sp. NBC_01089]
MTVKSRREEYAALTRAALLEASSELFVAKGFGPTSVDDIAAAARVSKGAVYYHFPDKRTIFDEVFRESQQAVMAHVAEAAASGQESPWAIAEASVRAFLHSFEIDADKRSLLRQSAGVLGVERCREIDDELALPQMRFLLEVLENRGELQPVDLDTAATVIFGMLCEAATSVAFARNPKKAAREAGQVVVHLLSGLRKSTES